MGRKPDLERQRQAKELRAQGLTYQEIADRLGITRQGAAYHLQSQLPIRCRACDTDINPAGALARDDRKVFCLSCLKRAQGVPAGVVLRSLRLAAGLTVKELTERSGLYGLYPGDVSVDENGGRRMRPSR